MISVCHVDLLQTISRASSSGSAIRISLASEDRPEIYRDAFQIDFSREYFDRKWIISSILWNLKKWSSRVDGKQILRENGWKYDITPSETCSHRDTRCTGACFTDWFYDNTSGFLNLPHNTRILLDISKKASDQRTSSIRCISWSSWASIKRIFNAIIISICRCYCHAR